ELLLTALELALRLAEKYLDEARAIRRQNAASCVRYLQAAQTALEGLEDEVDQILTEAKIVARFQWDRRPELLKRIDDYLNRYRLAKVLGQSVQGIRGCQEAA